jgi:hypothetical protein
VPKLARHFHFYYLQPPLVSYTYAKLHVQHANISQIEPKDSQGAVNTQNEKKD